MRPPCPICGAPVVEAFRPFCSRRCADVDLGRWLTGSYAIPGEPAEPDEAVPHDVHASRRRDEDEFG
ncbi:MAG: DNA gyrase inhibitor YacG [Pseudomonadota bacterium]